MHIISGDLWAGAEAMAYQLLSGLKQSGNVDLHLIIMNEGRLEQKCRQLGIHCYLIDERKLSTISMVAKAIHIARKIKPDIIHSHRYKENILAAIVAGFCGRPRLIATQHGRSEIAQFFLPKVIVDGLNRFCLRWIFIKTVAVSMDTADYLWRALGLNHNKISIISNGISLPPKGKKPNRYGADRMFTIGSAGRLFPVKRFDTLIEIAAHVCRVNTQVRFVIAGEGPEKKKMKALIAQYGLEDQVQLMGHVDDMQAFYDDLDLYINTSMHEGTPMSILEAMATGLPVIAFDVGGLRAIITDSVDGFTITKKNSFLFVSKIIELIDHPKLLKELGENAQKKIISRFSMKRMVESYLALYCRISGRHQ